MSWRLKLFLVFLEMLCSAQCIVGTAFCFFCLLPTFQKMLNNIFIRCSKIAISKIFLQKLIPSRNFPQSLHMFKLLPSQLLR